MSLPIWTPFSLRRSFRHPALFALLGLAGLATACSGSNNCEATKTCARQSGGAAGMTTGAGGSAGAAASTSAGMGGGGMRGCAPGTADCNGDPRDGCEVDIVEDPDNCGGCNGGCGTDGVTTRTCDTGVCEPVCASGRADCSVPELGPDDGCETDIDGSTDNCGACGRGCSTAGAATTVCVSGACQPTCNTGFEDCATPLAPEPDDGCNNPDADPAHCGACGHACSLAGAASSTCMNGGCVPLCRPGNTDCTSPAPPESDDGCETQLDEDVEHCGQCDHACSSDGATATACVSGACAPTCDTNRADCATPALGTTDDGCEADLQTDSANCNACGRGCLGGTCETGICQPVLVAPGGPSTAESLALNDTHVFVLPEGAGGAGNPAAVTRVPKTGGTFEPVHTALSSGTIAATDTHLYFSQGFTIRRVPVTGGSADLVQTLGNSSVITDMAVDQTHVYWADSDGQVVDRSGLTGGTPETRLMNTAAQSITLDDTHVYAAGGGSVFGVVAALKSGGGFAHIENCCFASAVGVESQVAFYDNGFEVWRSPLSPINRQKVGDVLGTNRIARDIAPAGPLVYFTAWSNTDTQGQLQRMPSAGGTAVVAQQYLGLPQLAHDDEAIYVMDPGQGHLYRVAK